MEVEALVAEYPLRERLRGQLMSSLYRCGRQADALEVYADGRRRLDSELGLEPGRALQELQRRILSQDPALEPRPGWSGSGKAGSRRSCRDPSDSGVRRSWWPEGCCSAPGSRLPPSSSEDRPASVVRPELSPADRCAQRTGHRKDGGRRDADERRGGKRGCLGGERGRPDDFARRPRDGADREDIRHRRDTDRRRSWRRSCLGGQWRSDAGRRNRVCLHGQRLSDRSPVDRRDPYRQPSVRARSRPGDSGRRPAHRSQPPRSRCGRGLGDRSGSDRRAARSRDGQRGRDRPGARNELDRRRPGRRLGDR